MNLLASAWVRRCAVRVLDTCVQGCFRSGLTLLGWRDALDPPPPPPADLGPRIIARIRRERLPEYIPSVVDREAAAVAEQHDCQVFLLHERNQQPAYVMDDDERRVPRS